MILRAFCLANIKDQINDRNLVRDHGYACIYLHP
jgi:hypothetical protein